VADNILLPRLDYETLTKAHMTLCALETELKTTKRFSEAELLGYVDLIVLALRNRLRLRREE
jgi:hypothetical protein